MRNKSLSLKTIPPLVIITIGFLSLGLVYIVDIEYRSMSFDHQKTSLGKLLAVTADKHTALLAQKHQEAGFTLISQPVFMRAFNNQNIAGMESQLGKAVDQYSPRNKETKLEKIIIYDGKLNQLATSDRSHDFAAHELRTCNTNIANAEQQMPLKHFAPDSDYCIYDDRPVLSTMVSMEGSNKNGIMQIISDATGMVDRQNQLPNVFIKISTVSGTLLKQSDHWPENEANKTRYLSNEYLLKSKNGNPVMAITGLIKIDDAYSEFNAVRNKTLATLVFIILVMLLMTRAYTTKKIKPLSKTRDRSKNTSNHETSQVEEDKSMNLSSSIQAFNSLIQEFGALREQLETDIIDLEENESIPVDKISLDSGHTSANEKQEMFLDITLRSISDGIITTNEHGDIASINPMAEKLTGWSVSKTENLNITKVLNVCSLENNEKINLDLEDIMNHPGLNEHTEAALVHKNGNIKTKIEYSITPITTNNNISGFVVVIHDTSSQRSLNRHLSFHSSHDALTGLMNKNAFEQELKDFLKTSTISKNNNALLYIDFDQIKVINTVYGHDAGNVLLEKITGLVKQHLDESCTFCRLGNSDFSILVKNCNSEQAGLLSQNILKSIGDYKFLWKKDSYSMSAEIGIVNITPGYTSFTDILDDAVSACHRARGNGSNTYHIYAEQSDRYLTQQREMHWVTRIGQAIEDKRLDLYFQKIIALQDNSEKFDHHGEILLRMANKKGEIIPPDSFLPAANRYNIISTIDEWVIKQTVQWQVSTGTNLLASINISGKSLSNKNFIAFIVDLLGKNNIDPRSLCFEINEIYTIDHLTTAIHFMSTLKKIGCRFALDNFGYGHSSFSYLESLPVDYLKIDGSFIMDIDKDPIHHAMVRSIHATAKNMGIKTIAEYATSQEIIKNLQDIGIDYAQGYAIAKPVPLDTYLRNNDSKLA